MKAAKTPQPLANTAQVDAFMQKLGQPMKDVLQALREIILAADSEVGEHIKWNAPSFLYTGEMASFNPKEYKRHIIVSNFFKQDCIRLVFPSGFLLNDTSGMLEGDYADGRRVALFFNMQDVESRKIALQHFIKNWISLLDI
ncbi:DUF1801 domain-containing protein [Mucilaginibacter gilvus]|uniref:DUF1801 domain-containing protein n=1 Tax=Mucilaginibacter gilvus TaxID=2305909 RepID=A0A3S3Z0J2_9SPHI|nr:DUF1801 domain-containing protein [Mucilaginibacter gilvus]RWY50291.1 DUF1801 domain-containing protein [Mucilaginibacter gilvus]